MRGLLACIYLCIPAASLAEEELVSFIHLNDLHANLTPHSDLVRVVQADGQAVSELQNRGGIARIATLVKNLRSENTHTVLMNIGDTYHGGVEALYTRGNAIIEPVKALNIDIGVPGNWDFAYGPITTRLRYSTEPSPLAELVNKIVFKSEVKKPGYPVIAANVRKTLAILFEDEPLVPATHMLSRGSVKIGFIGITSDIVERMSPMLAWGFTFLQGEEAYKNLINTHAKQLREHGANLVVVLSELGLHRDHQLANVIDPGVDIFFSAHTHELTATPLTSRSGAIVVEAGNDAYLGKMNVSFNNGKPAAFNWEVLALDDTIKEDTRMAALVTEARAPFLADVIAFDYPLPGVTMPLTEPIDTVVGKSRHSLHRRNVLENPFNNLLSDAMRNYYQTDIALTPGFRFDSVIAANSDITLEQLYRYLPVPPLLAKGTITGKNLKAVFETELMRVFSADAFEHSGGWLMGISGLNLSVDLSQVEGQRVIAMARSKDNSPIAADDVLTVVSCIRPFDDSDVMCSNPGFESAEQLPGPSGDGWTPLQLLRQTISTGTLPARNQKHIHDKSDTLMWPDASFLQPLRSEIK